MPIFNLMEDAATAEISRAQVWQWIRNPRGVLSDGRKVTKELFHTVLNEELAEFRWVDPITGLAGMHTTEGLDEILASAATLARTSG